MCFTRIKKRLWNASKNEKKEIKEKKPIQLQIIHIETKTILDVSAINLTTHDLAKTGMNLLSQQNLNYHYYRKKSNNCFFLRCSPFNYELFIWGGALAITGICWLFSIRDYVDKKTIYDQYMELIDKTISAISESWIRQPTTTCATEANYESLVGYLRGGFGQTYTHLCYEFTYAWEVLNKDPVCQKLFNSICQGPGMYQGYGALFFFCGILLPFMTMGFFVYYAHYALKTNIQNLFPADDLNFLNEIKKIICQNLGKSSLSVLDFYKALEIIFDDPQQSFVISATQCPQTFKFFKKRVNDSFATFLMGSREVSSHHPVKQFLTDPLFRPDIIAQIQEFETGTIRLKK